MIPDRNPPDTWFSVRDHGKPVAPGQKRAPRGTLATSVPTTVAAGRHSDGLFCGGPSWGWLAHRPHGQAARETAKAASRAALGQVAGGGPGADHPLRAM